MSSRQTWERRVIAGILEHIDKTRLDLIEGLVKTSDSEFMFSHEALSQTEMERVERSVDSVRDRLAGVYNRLGGTRTEPDSDSELEEQEEPPTGTRHFQEDYFTDTGDPALAHKTEIDTEIDQMEFPFAREGDSVLEADSPLEIPDVISYGESEPGFAGSNQM